MTPASLLTFGSPSRRVSLPVTMVVGLALAVAAVVAMTWATLTSLRDADEASDSVQQTMEIIVQLEALMSALKDVETGQRGYLLTGEVDYLEPYRTAALEIDEELRHLGELLRGQSAQLSRIAEMRTLIEAKLAEIDATVRQVHEGRRDDALRLVRTNRGKQLMDRLRALVGEMQRQQRDVLVQRTRDERAVQIRTRRVIAGSSVLLLALIGLTALSFASDLRRREREAWLRAGQLAVTAAVVGQPTAEALASRVLEALCRFLGAPVGVVLLVRDGGRLQAVAQLGLSAVQSADSVADPLAEQAVRSGDVLLIREVPAGHLALDASLAKGPVAQIFAIPAAADDRVEAVIELGFFRHLNADDETLAQRIAEPLAIALRSARDRARLQQLLEETQRQAEEMQSQQEVLRVTNEELEQQSRALLDSQDRATRQQADLEFSYLQLQDQRDALTETQAVLRERADELERANRVKGEFLANMSHELRTPLNSMLILSQLLADNREGLLGEEQVRFARTIHASGQDLLVLINDILDLSRLEARQVEVQPEDVAVGALVASLRDQFLPLVAQRGVAFEASVEPGVPAMLRTDGQRLAQILRNLLSNAVKFTHEGRIGLRVAAAAQGQVEFSVSDSGIGIDADHQALIFEAFRQADGSTHRKYGGSGLGLSISRDLARLLGGDLIVESTLGSGSVFRLNIPARLVSAAASATIAAGMTEAAAAPSAALEKAATRSETTPSRKKPQLRTILVVEDDANFAGILADLVREMGFEARLAHNAANALLLARSERPGGILLDVHLPDRSGLGLLDELRADPATRDIPVHVASVSDYRREALDLGAVGYLVKPASREQLSAAIRNLEAHGASTIRHVLVVEDEPVQQAQIASVLTNAGFCVTCVSTGEEARTVLSAESCDCLVLDLQLPDMDGLTLLETVAGEDRAAAPPVIVHTARMLDVAQEQRLRQYAQSIIIKGERSPERLLDEVTLFLHRVETDLPQDQQRAVPSIRAREDFLVGRRVLVVEDDARNIFVLASLLEPTGAELVIARDGREALEVIAGRMADPQTAIELVLMDLMMPGMDGLTATREIRARAGSEWQQLPIIALTAKAMKDDQERCLQAGANDYLSKPIDIDRLMSLLRVWMPKPRQ